MRYASAGASAYLAPSVDSWQLQREKAQIMEPSRQIRASYQPVATRMQRYVVRVW